MKSHYPNMAIPLKKHPSAVDVVLGILAVTLMFVCLISFMAIGG